MRGKRDSRENQRTVTPEIHFLILVSIFDFKYTVYNVQYVPLIMTMINRFVTFIIPVCRGFIKEGI